ncbi:MAG: hypothetical protein COB37_10210 [Kordiimonadales bacterium]|nr:MAG: hypothetical protein COB37_10210 [Kordiimonadales bacterium]
MKKAIKIIGSLLTATLLVLGALHVSGTYTLRDMVIAYSMPSHGWGQGRAVAPPNYADQSSWAALPKTGDLSDKVPAGVTAAVNAPVDVFFIHPTGFLNGKDWNSHLEIDSRTEENTQWMMINQASAFNGCCSIYAPRYRQATYLRYFSDDPTIIPKSMGLAYSDVERAFDYFITHHSAGRPFILASHSQGTAHAEHLMKARIDDTPLAGRMVAAYLIGNVISNDFIDNLKSVKACETEADTGCIIHWVTYGENPTPQARHKNLLCTNPLNWLRDGARTEAAAHRGAITPSGEFARKPWGGDSAAGTVFGPLAAPTPNVTWAECRDGLLTVADFTGTPLAAADLGGKNYHGLDFPLFYMDIRFNAVQRVEAFLKNTSQ